MTYIEDMKSTRHLDDPQFKALVGEGERMAAVSMFYFATVSPPTNSDDLKKVMEKSGLGPRDWHPVVDINGKICSVDIRGNQTIEQSIDGHVVTIHPEYSRGLSAGPRALSQHRMSKK